MMEGVPLPLARTPHESHLYIQLHPCACGTSGIDHLSHSTWLIDDDRTAGRDECACQGCGQSRMFLFALPKLPLRLPQYSYGDERPSELLDPGEWLWVGMRYAAAAQAGGRADLWQWAGAAVDEVVKFVPSALPLRLQLRRWTGRRGAVRVRDDAIPSALGKAVLQAMPDVFAREALVERADQYRRGRVIQDEGQLRELRIDRHPDGLARDQLIEGLIDRIRRLGSTGDPSALSGLEVGLEIDAVLGPKTPFDLVASYTCGIVLWHCYSNSRAGSALARAVQLMAAVHAASLHFPEADRPAIPEELLLLVKNHHGR